MSQWIERAKSRTLPAEDRTGAIIGADTLTDLGAILAERRTYTAADLQRQYAREIESGYDADDAAERVARSIVR